MSRAGGVAVRAAALLGADLHRQAAPSRRWYVVNTQARKETFAAANLANQGFEFYLPQITRFVRHARTAQRVLRPLFPRYLFVRLDLASERWRSVLGTFGVSTLIMEGERPRAVPVGVVEELLAASDGRGGFDFRARLQPGSRVRFLDGPFAERLGRLVEMEDAGRVAVLLEILGAERVVVVSGGSLAPADD